GSVICEFDLNCATFSPSNRGRIVRLFEKLLDACLADLSREIDSIDILDDEERVFLESWNETERVYPNEGTVTQLFEEQVARRPDAVALTHADESLSYREL